MGILELVLTVCAWKKGWNFKALLPGAAALMIGIYLGSTGGTASTAIVVDFAAIAVLGFMAANGPKSVSAAA
jgi:hypothetical protein